MALNLNFERLKQTVQIDIFQILGPLSAGAAEELQETLYRNIIKK